MPDDEFGDDTRHGDETRERPTMNQPLNAKERPVWTPLILLVAIIASLVLIYVGFGTRQPGRPGLRTCGSE